MGELIRPSMSIENIFQGSLFAHDFLSESIAELVDWENLDTEWLKNLESALQTIFDQFPATKSPNESQTEDDLIWLILKQLGWTASLRQQNLSIHGREDVPDGLLFANQAAKDQANEFAEEWKRYEFGLAVIESKRWRRPLDRRSGRKGEETAPSTQMLRYLRRVEDLTTGKLRWGILTNGAKWRLYYQGARSVSEQFFEIDLATLFQLPSSESKVSLSDDQSAHWLKVFAIVFRRESFLSSSPDERTFHQRAIEKGRFYEERVAANLSTLVFDQIFPELASAIAGSAPEASLEDVREAALILLYRLLFILYAEDRNLLPVDDSRYDDYALRHKVRDDVRKRKDLNDVFSATAAQYWSAIDDLCRIIDSGDSSIGLPPYNGGLFDRKRTPLLENIRLSDEIMARVIDALSFEETSEGRHYINYRDLGVQQLGSIYERLLEHEVVYEDDKIAIRPNIFARKQSGSYYTPDELVALIINETIEPLVQSRMGAFATRASEPASDQLSEDLRMGRLKQIDPAEKLLKLKVCDPAMGSGHFLVNLVDYLADRVIEAMAEAEATVEGYISPLNERVDAIRITILANAEERNWTVDLAQLDDRHIIRRMVLKRCVYGVDKNPMAVELAKVALWLHTFTVGAPLSFLDHHLHCGDSLFGFWVHDGIESVAKRGGRLLSGKPLNRAMRAASHMQIIEGLTDAEIAEAHRSADVFAEVKEMTAPLNTLLSLAYAMDWLNKQNDDDKRALSRYFDGTFGDPVDIATGKIEVPNKEQSERQFAGLFREAQQLAKEERFFNWQVAYPGVWSDWERPELTGGFDAVIGNPPWDRIKLQQVEWFAARKREIALAPRAADRKRMIADLEKAKDPLFGGFVQANERSMAAARVARSCGDYPLLSGGDINLYSLFVERAMRLVKPSGVIGLLTPSGIASDKTAAKFFKSIATNGKLKALYDFENRRTRYDTTPFFPDVDSRFKFCAFVAGRAPTEAPANCAFFLQDVAELDDSERCFPLTADDFAKVNPNTGTAPTFRSRRDAELTTTIYERLPVLLDRFSGHKIKAWPVKYSTMFHMTNDSSLFRTRKELEEKEDAYPVSHNCWRNKTGDWVPLYEGKMAQAFDHRAASVIINLENQHRPAQPVPASHDQHSDPAWLPEPQFWVLAEKCGWPPSASWVLGFKEITAPTNERTFISTIFPTVAFGNKIPLLKPTSEDRREYLLCANFNSIVFDFVVRQKIQGQTLNMFIIEQLPVVPFQHYELEKFGNKAIGQIVREIVLELTYTAYDMAPFARDLGYVDKQGTVREPFAWDNDRRLMLRAKLDAVYFHLYGISNREDVRYIYSTFPIVEQHEMAKYGRYRSCELCLAWINAFTAGDPDAEIFR